MSTAGEAASLFGGSPDTANDPFATALGADADAVPTEQAQANDQEASNAAGLFGGPAGETDLFGATTTTTATSTDAQGYQAYNPAPTDYGNGYDAYGAQSSGAGNQYAQQQAYGTGHTQYGTTSGYGQQQSTSGYGTYNSSTYDNRNYPYDAYSSFAVPSQAQYGMTPATSYDSYAPAATNAYSAAPASDSTSSQAYDPYKPATTSATQHAPVGVSDFSSIRSPPAIRSPPPIPIPPPATAIFQPGVPTPPPTASAYRLATRNAYDPPLPPPKPAKRVQHWQSHNASLDAVALSTGPASRILTPPPPPPRGTTPSRLNPAAPPLSSSPVQHTRYASPPVGTVPHQNAPAAPPNQYQYNGAPSGYQPPAPAHRADVYTPPPPQISPRAPPPPVSSYAPPAPSATEYTAPPNGHYANGVVDDDGLGLYNRPSSPQKPSSYNETYPETGPASSGYEPFGASQSAGDFHSSVDEVEGVLYEPQTLEHPPFLPPSVSTSPPLSIGHIRSKPTSPEPIDLSVSPTQVHQKVLSRQHSPERTHSRAQSPGASSIRSIGSGSGSGRSVEQPVKRPSINAYAAPPVASSYDPPVTHPTNAYASSTDHIRRTGSPATFSSLSPPLPKEAPHLDAYAPPPNGSAGPPPMPRDRSMSSGSTFSISSSISRDPYAPSSHSRQQSTDSHKFASPPQPFHVPAENGYGPSTYDRSGAQVLSVASRLNHAYAPSPSLLGSNDPLGRTSVKVPIVSFGFGGKLATCFHGASSNIGVGFDVALSSRQSTDVHVRTIQNIIPQSALDNSSVAYPGPLFSDPGSPTASLVRTGAAARTGTKKAKVIKYLEERAEEIARGLGYMHLDSLEGRRAEARHTLLLVLKVMVENDGKLSGSSQIDAAVRQALVPTVATSESVAEAITSPPLLASGFPGIGTTSFGASGSAPSDPSLSVHTLRGSHLDKIEELLVRGERRLAFQYAADEKLWAHAMVIASSVDREAWRDVVKEFVHAELASTATGSSEALASAVKGREALRVAYSLFAGEGAASVQQLAPQKLLIDNVSGLQVPPIPHGSVTPLSPNFAQNAPSAVISPEILSKWVETAAMIVSNPMTTETSSALTALGDQLLANHWIEAAHVCYLLSPQTSPLGGCTNPTARIILVGGPNPLTTPNFWKDPDPVILSEITEFALSLATPVKGQEAFTGLPHLQAYRLIRATYLAEIGHVQLAHRYCEAISSCLGRNSPYVHTHLVTELKSLSDRLIAAPQLEKGASWIGGKMTRPSLDKLGNWLEGRFTSFIAGEGDSPTPEAIHAQDRSFTGPFAHFSQISSATSSTIPTPQQSVTDLTEVPHAPTPPYRSGSAMALRPPSQVQINRASSAMDHIRRKASPVPRVSSASATTGSFTDAYTNGYGHAFNSTPKSYHGPTDERLPEASPEAEAESSPVTSTLGPQLGSWWGDSSESGAPTPTATTFVQPDEGGLKSADGFVSMMDSSAFSVTPTPSSAVRANHSSHSYGNGFDDEEDDLGLGNSASRAKAIERTDSSSSASSVNSSSTETAASGTAKSAEKPAESKAQSSGWLSRLWRRSDTPQPVKANLGEQTSFYYDKELKRWVNKESGGGDEKPSMPPPPPRAQTASPGTATARLPTGPPTARTPPVRPATAIDLTDSPPKQPPMRVRSNLVPQDVQSAPNSPATARPPMPMAMDGPPGLDGPPPPGARAKAAGAKRNVRSRYVDVFQGA
ncbi:hypothetical protein EIP91_000018 [Steccherinum ochraceum]|uniref:Protein transport protein sec16 n=1 Tax=Steccherinum ochraceum TaxID=92696 RepID=A0A4R0RUW6_9APHY|nr:hypothetical protein EIP91_000018 [Steccherinum ochraceum]